MLKKVFIKFGDACNLNCSYCLQDKTANQTHELNKFFLQDISEKTNKNVQFVLLGGEPLLWKDKIRKSIEILKSKHEITIVTNGTLLTENDISYFNDMDVKVTISWDGHTSIIDRGYDALCEENIFKIANIKKLGLSSLITNKSFFLDKFEEIDRINYIRSKKEKDELSFQIKPTYGLIYTDTSLRTIKKESLLLPTLIDKSPSIKKYVNELITRLTYDNPPTHKSCGTNIFVETYTSNGTKLRCPSAPYSDMKVNESVPDIDEFCFTCPIYKICKLPCYYLTKNMNNFCSAQRAIHAFLL